MKKLFYHIFLPFSFLSATIINIPADYSTIQDGISASADLGIGLGRSFGPLSTSALITNGVGNEEKKSTAGLHTPTFNIDEEAMQIGSGLMAYLAIKELHN